MIGTGTRNAVLIAAGCLLLAGCGSAKASPVGAGPPATATTPRLLNALTWAPESPRWTESISTPAVSSASSIAFLIDSTVFSPPRVQRIATPRGRR